MKFRNGAKQMKVWAWLGAESCEPEAGLELAEGAGGLRHVNFRVLPGLGLQDARTDYD